MPNSRKISPARSQDVNSSHTRTPRRSRSVCSAKSNTSLRLTALISDSFKLTPIAKRQSVLNDDTDIEIPGRKSWWRKLGENSRDVMDVLENRDVPEVNNVADEFDVEILSQEKKNYSLDLPESSDGESINSIVIPQRKLFTQKENQPQTKFGNIFGNRETLAKHQKSHIDEDKEIKIAKKNLFNQAPRQRIKPAFPAALLNISSKTVNKTKEMPTAEVKGQVRNLFGNRPGVKRKNMFADFILSESEDEIPDIQPKVFGFQKNMGQKRRESSASHGIAHSLTSSIDLEMDDWKLLPSSTMVETQLEEAGTTPVKRAKLSKLSEAKESETTNTNSTVNKTKQSNKSINSKNKSKNTSKSKLKEGNKNLNLTSERNNEYEEENNQSIDNSSNLRLTRNRSKSIRESSTNEKDHSKIKNKSKNSLKSIQSISDKGLVQEDHKSQHDIKNNMETNLRDNEIQNLSTEHDLDDDDEDFTLEYENDDEQLHSTKINKLDNINEKESNNQSNNTTVIEHQVEKVLSKTNNKEDKNEKNKTQNDRDEQDNVNNLIEEQVQPNKQQNQSLINNSDKKENERTNQSQDIVKLKKHTLTVFQNNSRECETINIGSDNIQKAKNSSNKIVDKAGSTDPEESREAAEEVDTNQSLNDEPNESNGFNHEESIEAEEEEESNKSLNNKQNDSDEDEEAEEEIETNQILNDEQSDNDDAEDEEAEEEAETNQTLNDEQSDNDEAEDEEAEEEVETNQTLNDEQSDNDEAEDVETGEEVETNQTLNDEQSDNDEAEDVEAEEEVETDQTLNNEQSDNDEAEDEEAEEEVETNQTLNDEQSDNDEAEDEVGETDHSNSDDQEESDSEVNQNETEEQHIEEMEIHEEENDSEIDEQNETENQEVSDDAESDDNQQNESNITQSENIQESGQEQSDVDDNEVAKDEIIPDESDDPDTRGRHRKKNETIVKSPEAILHDKISEMESFTAKGRNTSIRKTKSIIKNINIRPSLAPVRESTGLTDGTRDSSAEGSGWDSHRTTRKTIRLTMGKDITLRKSLRALVMEKSAKRNTEFNEVLADNPKIPQANSTELPAFDSYQETEPMHVDETVEEPSDHEVSAQTKRTTLELYLQKIKQENMEKKRKMEEEVRASLKAPPRNTFYSFKVPMIPVRRIKVAQNKPKPKQTKSSLIPLNMLPPEVLEDMKYKPPKRFQPSNASWITKRLYKFIENKLEPKYDYKARVRAERFMEFLYAFTREARQVRGPSEQAVDTLKKEMARLDIVKTHFEFYNFFNDFMPREIRIKVVPDLVNKISLPKNGIFSDIMQ